MRDIDPCVIQSAGDADSVSCRKGCTDPMRRAPLRRIGIALTVAALCAANAGCISDTATSMSGASQAPADGGTMRYYGGPKYPMWSSQ